nr:hypothetical protein Ade03nite_37790 [Actinoplanes derwentensis]
MASKTRQKTCGARSSRVNKRVGRHFVRFTSGRRQNPSPLESPVADLGFVVLTVVLFAALTVLIRAVER